MEIQTSLEQAAGILLRADLHFQLHEDGRSYRLLFGRDAVFIQFRRWGDGVRVRVNSPALQELDRGDAGYAVLLNRVGELNRDHVFVKWTVDDRLLLASHDLLGDELRACELVNSVGTMARAVRRAADELADVTGGTRYQDMLVGECEEVEDE
jgi:hypothetical protein